MLGVGWTEMLIIGVVALIVIGPKELPALMHKIGKFAGTIRRMGQDFQRELNKTTGLDEVKNLRASIAAPLKATTDAIRKEFNTTTSTGQVEPSGALKPADPKAESVVDEIHAAAGIAAPAAKPVQTPAEAMKEAVAKATKDTALPGPAKAAAKPRTVKAAPRVKAAAAPVEAPAKPKVAVKKAAPRKVESPAPAEAVAPAKPRTRKQPAADEPVAVAAPAKRRAAAKKATT